MDFPEKLGYPVGGAEYDLKYVMLEIHYDNPEMKNGKIYKLLSNV